MQTWVSATWVLIRFWLSHTDSFPKQLIYSQKICRSHLYRKNYTWKEHLKHTLLYKCGGLADACLTWADLCTTSCEVAFMVSVSRAKAFMNFFFFFSELNTTKFFPFFIFTSNLNNRFELIKQIFKTEFVL